MVLLSNVGNEKKGKFLGLEFEEILNPSHTELRG